MAVPACRRQSQGGGERTSGTEGRERSSGSQRTASGARTYRRQELTSTHSGQGEPDQQECLQAERQIHTAPPAAPWAWPGGGEVERSGVCRPRKTVTAALVGWWAQSSWGSRAAPQAGWLCACRLPLPAASLPPAGSAAKLAPVAPGAVANSFQEAGCSAEAPTARGPGCQRECSLLTLGAAFCSLWLGQQPTWSCGHPEGWRGGPGRERGGEPPAPPPSQHSLCSPSQGPRGNLDVAP